MNNPYKGAMRNLTVSHDIMSGRSTAADHSGGGKDFWWLSPGESTIVTQLEGPGCITHIWMSCGSKVHMGPNIIDDVDKEDHLAPLVDIMPVIGVNWDEPDPGLFRKVMIKITWDDMEYPSVLAPLGDFFGVCNGQPASYNCAGFAVDVQPHEQLNPGATCGMNCYLPMPFKKGAKIELVSESENPVFIQCEVMYELYKEPLPENTVYFHACWTRENLTKGWGTHMLGNCPEVNHDLYNDGKDNFVFFEAEGKGHFVGCNLTIITPVPNEGFPEGDDMFFIDGDETPTMNGCGHECFFNRGFGFDPHPWLYTGSIISHAQIPDMEAAYRLCIADPIYFDKSIKFTMEHGHANIYAEDWAATSYWYQTLPGKPITIQPLEERLPNLPARTFRELPKVELTDIQKERLEAYNKRYADWLEKHKEFDNRRYEHTREASRLNIEKAKKQRERFMQK